MTRLQSRVVKRVLVNLDQVFVVRSKTVVIIGPIECRICIEHSPGLLNILVYFSAFNIGGTFEHEMLEKVGEACAIRLLIF